jgi:hypothetical protein
VEDEPDANCLIQKAELPTHGSLAFFVGNGGIMKKIGFMFVLSVIVMCSVSNVFYPFQVPGTTDTEAWGVNNSGIIVGN